MDIIRPVINFNWNSGNNGFESYVGIAWDEMKKFLDARRNETGFDGSNLFHWLKDEYHCNYIGNGLYEFTVHSEEVA